MRLKTAQIQNFKCVYDSGEFKIDPRVTCLVGKNESGKTALLQALYRLNPVVASASSFEDIEYPRSQWSEYQEGSLPNPANVLTTVWELSPEDIAAVTAVVGPAAAVLQEVTISKGYGKDTVSYGVRVDESKAVSHLLQLHDLNAQERSELSSMTTIQGVKEKLDTLEKSPQVAALKAHIDKHFARGTASLAVIDVLHPRMPKFVYFNEYMRLAGQMSINDFKSNRGTTGHPKANEYRMFAALLGLVNKTPDAIEGITRFEPLQAELEAVSARLSRTIFKYWSQNKHLRVQFRFDAARPGDPAPFNDGWIMRTRIENTRHNSTTGFDERSTGFVWFFSFLVWFSQTQKNYGTNLVVLLDEPGNSLHAKAQADLLRYVEEELAPKYQVIYTTHSPFMIDPANLLRVRTVEDVVSVDADGVESLLGTRVHGDVLSTDRDTVFPLQAALGYELTQSLFVGKHTLLVEGPSDLLYLKWFQRSLEREGRITLDKRWTIAPCGGIDKVAAFMSLFRASGLNVAVLVDYKDGDKKKVRSLEESRLLAEGHVLTASTFAGLPEADIEDLLGAEMYCWLVNDTYGLKDDAAVVVPTAKPGTPAGRIVPFVEAAFRILPAEVPEFDHYAPAEHLASALADATNMKGLAGAMDRFEDLFKQLNGMLPDEPTNLRLHVSVRPMSAGTTTRTRKR